MMSSVAGHRSARSAGASSAATSARERGSSRRVYAGGTAPLEDYRPDGMKATPSVYVSAASGYASRVHYIWVSAGYQRYSERERRSRRRASPTAPSTASGRRSSRSIIRSRTCGSSSRPWATLRRGQPHGFEMVTSGGQSLLVGPTALLLYKAYGIEGGVLFPGLPAHQRPAGERLGSPSTSPTSSGESERVKW